MVEEIIMSHWIFQAFEMHVSNLEDEEERKP
jgi:hypothetical protein